MRNLESPKARSKTLQPPQGHRVAGVRLRRSMALLVVVLLVATALALCFGYQRLSLTSLVHDEVMRSVFFRLRLPRVVLAGIVGASLALAGGSLQAFFRNPLADPFTLGVSGGGTLGASVAIALSWGTSIWGMPLVFLAAFAGAGAAVVLVYRLARTGTQLLPGTILLAGVVINLVSGAGVLIIQYVVDYTRALQILRWSIGSLDVVGFDLIWRMVVFLVPGWLVLLLSATDLHLLAMGEEAAASLGVNVRRCERLVYAAASLTVGVSVAVGGTIAFVGLIVPHTVRLFVGEDVRIVLPCSFFLGAAFLMLADTVARTALGASELPVGAVTAFLGGVTFLCLLRRRQRYSTI